MKNDPLVSIIIPAYNTGKYLLQAVDSAINQTYKNKEIIVIDDGSTDNTKELLNSYIKENKIKYIFQENQGLSAARNTGIKASKGDFIAFLDADDIFLLEKVQKQVNHLNKNSGIDISYCDLYHFFDDEVDKLYKLKYLYHSGEAVFENLLKYHFIAPLTLMIRKEVFQRVGLFNEILKRSEDLDFLLRASYKSDKISFLPGALAKLRVRRTDNLQGLESQPQVKLSNLKVIQDFSEKLTKEEKEKYKVKKLLKKYNLKIALAYILNNKKTEARKYFSKAGFSGKVIKVATYFIPAKLLGGVARSRFQNKQKANYKLVK